MVWGILASAVYPLATQRANQVFWTCTFGAVAAVVLVLLARRAARRDVTHPRRLRDLFFAFAHVPVRDAVNPLK
jgi:ABC-type transport system involved in cytochrome c biogenesis permease subunit